MMGERGIGERVDGRLKLEGLRLERGHREERENS